MTPSFLQINRTMPGRELMKWQGDRWGKMHNGKRFLVGPRTLKKEFPALFNGNTREGSRKAANAWWERMIASQPVLNRVDGADFMNLLGTLASTNFASADPQAVQQLLDGVGIEMNFAAVQGRGFARLEAALGEAVADERKLSSLIKSFLDVKQTKISIGGMSHASWDLIRMHLDHLQQFLGADTDCTTIDEQTVTRFFAYLAEKISGGKANKKRAFGPDYADGIMRTVRQFIRFLWSNRVCELPRNLTSADLRFVKIKKEIKTFSRDDVKALFDNATDRPKLYGLLMLNCGFLNIDIATLTKRSVDWKNGTITWKRHKEENTENVPTVTYKLWPETLRLLKQEHEISGKRRERWGQADTGLLLLTEGGKPLQTTKLKDIKGVRKLSKTDAIKLALRRAIKDAGLNRNPRQLRATASTMLENHEVFCRYEQHFLGHAPTGVASKHYVTPSQDQFDKALIWLGKEFGFCDLSSKQVPASKG